MGNLMRQLKAILWFFVESFSHIQRNCQVTKSSGWESSFLRFSALHRICRESQIPFVFPGGRRASGTGIDHSGPVGEIDSIIGQP
jgi:hypothetical protein